jgi:effector-binding domain-containing protein
MVDEFEVIEKSIGPVIEIEECVKMFRMPATFSRDYKRIMDYLASQGAECVDMPYARYQDMDWELELGKSKLATFFSLFSKKWHFFAGIPTSKPLPGEGELKYQVLESQRYVRAVHIGPYQQCAATYKSLYAWAKSQELSLKNEAIEIYVNDPNEVDKADIETVILIPITGSVRI